jgi:hypothetical protein
VKRRVSSVFSSFERIKSPFHVQNIEHGSEHLFRSLSNNRLDTFIFMDPVTGLWKIVETGLYIFVAVQLLIEPVLQRLEAVFNTEL